MHLFFRNKLNNKSETEEFKNYLEKRNKELSEIIKEYLLPDKFECYNCPGGVRDVFKWMHYFFENLVALRIANKSKRKSYLNVFIKDCEETYKFLDSLIKYHPKNSYDYFTKVVCQLLSKKADIPNIFKDTANSYPKYSDGIKKELLNTYTLFDKAFTDLFYESRQFNRLYEHYNKYIEDRKSFYNNLINQISEIFGKMEKPSFNWEKFLALKGVKGFLKRKNNSSKLEIDFSSLNTPTLDTPIKNVDIKKTLEQSFKDMEDFYNKIRKILRKHYKEELEKTKFSFITKDIHELYKSTTDLLRKGYTSEFYKYELMNGLFSKECDAIYQKLVEFCTNFEELVDPILVGRINEVVFKNCNTKTFSEIIKLIEELNIF